MRRKDQQVNVRVVITALDPQGALIEKTVAPSYRSQAEENLRKQGCRILEPPAPEDPWWLKYQTPAPRPPSLGEGLLFAVIGLMCLLIVCAVTFAACGAAMSP
jgi:hypothetical protein